MLRSLTRSAVAALLCFPFLVSSASAGGVRIVDATGARNFPDIQSAINAAVDGDVLLVGAGSYAGFTLDGKSLSIFAAPPGAQVSISNPVTVLNVSGSCLLVGLSVAPSGLYDRALIVNNCAGDVRFQDCSFTSPYGPCGYGSCWPGSPAADIVQSARVVLVRCALQAGNTHDGGLYGGVTGAHGLGLQGSTVAMYDTSVVGGSGPDSYHDDPGNGGPGTLVQASWLFASKSQSHGGQGGDNLTTAPLTAGGCGGAGVSIDGNSSVTFLDFTAVGGPGGGPYWWTCGNGPAIESQGGQLTSLPGVGRSFSLAPISVDRAFWSPQATGAPGDKVFLNRSLAPVFQYEPTLSGVCTALLPPFPAVDPLGVLHSLVRLPLRVSQPLLPDPVVARVYHLQGYVIDSAGATFLGSPMLVLSLNRNSLPDCNANGINDYAEVILGITPDANHDLIPDSCP